MTIEEAQLTATQWLWIYNNERPSMALGGITPAMKMSEFEKLLKKLEDLTTSANASCKNLPIY